MLKLRELQAARVISDSLISNFIRAVLEILTIIRITQKYLRFRKYVCYSVGPQNLYKRGVKYFMCVGKRRMIT